jgi:hypothetical protein
MKTLRAVLAVSVLFVTFSMSAANDVLTIGNVSAPKGTILVPVYVRDVSTTRLGVDQATGQRIQGLGFRVRFSPAGSITNATFSRAGALLKTPLYSKSFQGPDWAGYFASFAEVNNALAFTSNVAAPGNLIGYLTLSTSANVAVGTVINLNFDADSAILSNQTASTTETFANNGIALQNGSITVTSGSCTPASANATIDGIAGSCLLSTGGMASATVNAAGPTYQWGYRTTPAGAITAIPGATQSSYVISGADFDGVGTKYLVVVATPACGPQATSNELTISITTAPIVTILTGINVYASSPDNYASVDDQGSGATYAWTITNGSITSGQGTRRIRYTSGATGSVALGITVTKNGCADPGTPPQASVPIIPRPTGATMFYMITPCRIIDTRDPVGHYGGPASSSGSLRQIQITGACGIPTGAKSIAANVTAVSPTASGFLGLYASDVVWPGTSTISYRVGKTRANNSAIALSADGRIIAKNEGTTLHFIIDVTGYYK